MAFARSSGDWMQRRLTRGSELIRSETICDPSLISYMYMYMYMYMCDR